MEAHGNCRHRLLTIFQSFAILLMVTQTVPAMAAFTVPNDFTEANVTPLVEYYTGSENAVSIQQIEQLPESVWTRNRTPNLRFGFGDHAVWLRLKVNNPGGQPLLLVASNPLFDEITVYQQRLDALDMQTGGTALPPDQRNWQQRLPLFEIYPPDPDAQVTTIWIKTEHVGSYLLALKLWSSPAFEAQSGADMMTYGLYFGILLACIVLFLIGFLALREPAFLSLTFVTLAFSIFQITILGFGLPYFWHPDDHYRSILALSLGVTSISAYFFISQGLNLKQTFRIGEWLLRGFSGATVVLLMLMNLMDHHVTMVGLIVLMSLFALAVVGISLHLAIGGNRLAVFATIASFAVLLGIGQQVLYRLELVPATLNAGNTLYAGFLFMVICLAFGIGFEVHRRRLETERFKDILSEQNLAHQEALRAALESEVKARTKELESALTELSDANETLKLLNTVDQVSGIKNRYYFDTTFYQEWKRASREQYPLSLLMVDVDHFKRINDTYGHVVGDECLRQIAARLNGNIKRAADTVARYGGEEFVILLPYSGNDNANRMAEQLRQSVSDAPLDVDGEQIHVCVSIGVCTTVPTELDQPKDLVNAADLALYEAKKAGRDRVCNGGMLTKNAAD